MEMIFLALGMLAQGGEGEWFCQKSVEAPGEPETAPWASFYPGHHCRRTIL